MNSGLGTVSRALRFAHEVLFRAGVICAVCSSGCGSSDDGQGVLLNVVVDSPEDVGSVDYDVQCGADEPLRDVFETLGETLPQVFEAYIELPTGVCDLVLTALGEDGAPLCSAAVPLTITEGTIDEPTIVLPCNASQSVVNNFNVEIENLTLNVCVLVVVGARNIGGETAIEDTSTGDVQLEVTTIGHCSEEAAPEVLIDASFVCEQLDCDDGNECTLDICLDESTCINPATIDGVSCGGGGATCQEGVCTP